ncbi:MAG TPA: hypothetical protein DCL15_22095 [Chloroflexi bacterium]|nr:hypothetical protein [Chloroflexota bacterium]
MVGSLRPARSELKADVIAGLTFAVVNVPQAMAHALLAAGARKLVWIT